MQVIHQSPTALIVEARPWGTPLVAFWLSGICAYGTLQDAATSPGYDTVVLFLLSCFFMSVVWAVGQATRLTLDSRAREVLIDRRSLTGWSKRRLSMDTLHYADAEASGHGGATAWRRLSLVTQDGERVPVTLAFDDNMSPDETAQQINKWLGVPVIFESPKGFFQRLLSF